jgi:hypothetical protein
MRQVSTTVTPRPARGGSVPSSVVLPPPHVPDAGEAYDYRPDYFLPVDTLSYFSEGDG